MKAKTKLAVILSDTHIGSTLGLWPPNFVCNEGFTIGQNRFQEWLWEKWGEGKAWIKKVVGKSPFELIWNGDLVEGIHHRSVQIMSADVGDQSAAVLQVIGDLCGAAARTFVIQGTECHTRNDEVRIGKHIGAVTDPDTGKHAFDRLLLDFNGCNVSFAHHMSTTSRPYLEASAHSIQLGCEVIESARSGHPVPTVVVRAHRHLHGVFEDGSLMSVSTGGWQGLTRFARKVVPFAVPKPSIVILDWRETERGELPQVHRKIFKPKP